METLLKNMYTIPKLTKSRVHTTRGTTRAGGLGGAGLTVYRLTPARLLFIICIYMLFIRTYFSSSPPHTGRTRPLPDQLDHGVERRAQLEAAELDDLLHCAAPRAGEYWQCQ